VFAPDTVTAIAGLQIEDNSSGGGPSGGPSGGRSGDQTGVPGD